MARVKKEYSFARGNTWFIPLCLTSALLFGYGINPRPSNPLHKALFLSYELDPNDTLIPVWARPDAQHGPSPQPYYGKGLADFAFVGFYTIVLCFLRESIMAAVLRPLARYNGITARSRQNRFMEQMYTALYFIIFGPLGLIVMRQTPVWYFNTPGMYEWFPHRAHDALFKTYYLLQASYWAHQAIVMLLQLEKPRKDYYELIAHHLLTLTLIFLSYRFHFTYIGIAVFVSHDISDFFLATSLTLSYIRSRFVFPYFLVFLGVWIYLRHYINLRILYSITTEYRTIGPFELNWETQQYKSRLSQYITFPLLAALQALNLFWLFVILRIAYNAAFNNVRRDIRSDEEDEGEDNEAIAAPAAVVQEQLVAVDQSKKTPAAISSAVDVQR